MENNEAVAEVVQQKQQIEAVYELALKYTKEEDRANTPLKDLITKPVKKEMRLELFDLIKSGRVKYKKSLDNDPKIRKYCSSVINNFTKGIVKSSGKPKDARYHSVLQHPVVRKKD